MSGEPILVAIRGYVKECDKRSDRHGHSSLNTFAGLGIRDELVSA